MRIMNERKYESGVVPTPMYGLIQEKKKNVRITRVGPALIIKNVKM